MNKTKDRNQTTAKSFIQLSFLTGFDKILGFLYQMSIASLIGATIITDAYFSTFELISLIDSAILGATVVVLLKKYSKISVESGVEQANEYLSDMRSFVVIAVVFFSLLMLFLAEPISYVLAPKYDISARTILVKNIGYMAFVPVFNAVTIFYVVILRNNKRFVEVSLKSLFINLCGFCALFVYVLINAKDTLTLCIGFNVAIVLYLLFLKWKSSEYGVLNFKKLSWNQERISFLKLLIPLIVSNGIIRISLMIDRVISSTFEVGAVTCLTYAQMLFNFVEGIFVVNISTILLSDFTNSVAKNEIDKIKNKIKTVGGPLVMVLIPISIITFLYGNEIVRIIFGRGKFTEFDIERTGGLLKYYAIGFVPSVISNIYFQVLYAYGKTKKSMIISTISITINTIVSILIAMNVGLIGIAIGTSLSYIISAVLTKRETEITMHSKIEILNKKSIIKVSVASALACLALYPIRYLKVNSLLVFSISSIIGFGVFFGVLLMLNEEHTKTVMTIIRSKAKRLLKIK